LPNSGAFAALRDEALRRLQAHGLRLTHAIGLTYASKQSEPGALAYTSPLWLFGTGNYCQVTLTPLGVRDPVDARRASMLHELIHCAQAEAVNTAAQWSATPD